mmetsp:Transcript_45642/g.146936  ORF Transcript_45642/g.146936 Transcript_45642/m.146936 type:complete len:398 (+) Transcript_45642:917-2110(+)
MVGDRRKADGRDVREVLAALHERSPKVDELARVLAKGMHAHDAVRRRALHHQLECGPCELLAGRAGRRGSGATHERREVLALALAADGVHVPADALRVTADALDHVQVVRRRPRRRRRQSDEGELRHCPDANRVARRVREQCGGRAVGGGDGHIEQAAGVLSRADVAPAEHRVDRRLGLLNPRRRELWRADDVSRRVDPFGGGHEARRDGEVAIRPDLDAEGVEAEAIGDRFPARRREHEVRLELLAHLRRASLDHLEAKAAGRAARARGRRRLAAVALGARDLALEEESDAGGTQVRLEQVADLVVDAHARERLGQVGRTHHHRHLGGELREDACKLDGDDAAADDDHLAREEVDLLDRVRVAAAYVAAQRRRVPLLQRRQPYRPRARGEQHVVAP